MKKFLFMCSLILLAGCAGSGERLPDVQNANVDLHGTEPCIASVFAPGDRISSIQIGSTSGDKDSFRKYFTDNSFTTVSGKCLPLFDYPFSPGKKYLVYYSVDNPNNKRERIIQASFSMINELKNRS